MRNFVTVVFDDRGKTYEGLHALWQLDDTGDITAHGTAVVHRNDWGRFEVDTKAAPSISIAPTPAMRRLMTRLS